MSTTYDLFLVFLAEKIEKKMMKKNFADFQITVLLFFSFQ